jgi:hypothetical protein
LSGRSGRWVENLQHSVSDAGVATKLASRSVQSNAGRGEPG